MKTKAKPLFDPKLFLAKIGEGRSLADYQKNQKVFSQGDSADAVFYIQKGQVKLTVVSRQGKEAVVGILGVDNPFFGEGCLAGQSVRHGNRDRDVRVLDHADKESGNGPGAPR
jgi:CRP/FNR family transcriptional regulator, cyclic AMP receptor protein